MKRKNFSPPEQTKIKNLCYHQIRLSNGNIFYPPIGYQLDYADSIEGIYSYRSEAGFYRNFIWAGQNNSEFVPDSYFVKLDKITIEKLDKY